MPFLEEAHRFEARRSPVRQPLDYEKSPHLYQQATKERTRKVKREITIGREVTWVKDEGDSEIKRKKKPLS